MPGQSTHGTDLDGERTRRRYLATVGIAGGLLLAGCSGGSGPDDDGGGDDTPTDGDVPSATPDGESGPPSGSGGADTRTTADGSASSGCPSPPFEYERREIPTYAQPLASCEVPTSGPGVSTAPNQLKLDIGGTQLSVSSRGFPDRSVEERQTQLAEQEDYTEITDRYDTGSDTVVMTTDPDAEVPNVVRVLLPDGSGGVVVVALSIVGTADCASAIQTLQSRVVTTADVV